jgi:ABC-type dipeptide/oligopeptide/nickel transport system permease subunit
MISEGQIAFTTAPWLMLSPAILIFLTVLSFNLVGDGLRDALDPHMTER